MMACRLISSPSAARVVVSAPLWRRRRDAVEACTVAIWPPCCGWNGCLLAPSTKSVPPGHIPPLRPREGGLRATQGRGARMRILDRHALMQKTAIGGNGRGSSPREEIRRGSAAGASPRNGSASGDKTSGEDASVGMFGRASCVCSWLVTADMSSTARGKQSAIVRRGWMICQQQSSVWVVLQTGKVKILDPLAMPAAASDRWTPLPAADAGPW
jgi:hypothetical protein